MPLDIGVGIFGAIITANLAGIPLSWELLFIGIIFSLLPDVDFAIYFARTKQIDEFAHEHRDILHNPIVYIVIGFAILSFWSFPIAWLFAALSFLHFLHDSIPAGGGWGIRWLYPFSKKYYKFFSGHHDGKFAWRFAASWTHAEQRTVASQYGDREWVSTYPRSPEFLFECVVLLAALLTLIAIWR